MNWNRWHKIPYISKKSNNMNSIFYPNNNRFRIILSILLLFLFIYYHDQLYAVNGQEEYFPNFSGCNHSSPYMFNPVEFGKGTFREPKIPLSFECNSMMIYTIQTIQQIQGKSGEFRVDSYFGDVDACMQLNYWESRLNRTCIDLLCDYDGKIENLQEYLMLNTNGTNNLTDWINGCQYCLGRSEHFKKRVSTGTCQSRDRLSNRMINEFPTSIYFCGTQSFGIPFLVQSNSLFGKYTNDFLYLCSCFSGIKSKCYLGEDSNFDMASIYFFFASSLVLFILNTFISIIPKTKRMLRDRKYLNIIPSIYNGIFVGSWSICFGVVLFSNSLIIFIFLIAYQLSFNFLQLAIFSWLSNWIRLVRIVRHSPLSLRATIFLYVIPLFASISFGVILPFIVASIYTQNVYAIYFVNALESYLLGASIVSVIGMFHE